ncbi:carbon-nitrogen hydrolase family protein [gut metagenome]|uniref:Carbon-nitrogen hydrolase family protein n=1 Tax=gut metagenome TaxID=749906 RepID=J9D730_9ZZZZ
MKLTLLQTDICWENKPANLQHVQHMLQMLSGSTDLVVLPELFSTGFSMNIEALAEPVEGPTITLLRQWAQHYQLALAGSYLAVDSSSSTYYNRAFFLTPQGECYFYDKRHLFRMGHENDYYTAGTEQNIIHYQGWNIQLLICYDLRFPVWSRNTNNAYDLLIYVANWPAARRKAWDTLLPARAIENQAYVCGVNRTGIDGNLLKYNGGSAVYGPKGETLASIPDFTATGTTIELSPDTLHQFREIFPAWQDADQFTITF